MALSCYMGMQHHVNTVFHIFSLYLSFCSHANLLKPSQPNTVHDDKYLWYWFVLFTGVCYGNWVKIQKTLICAGWRAMFYWGEHVVKGMYEFDSYLGSATTFFTHTVQLWWISFNCGGWGNAVQCSTLDLLTWAHHFTHHINNNWTFTCIWIFAWNEK